MNNSVIDVAFIAAKVAAIKDEKARMIVGGASLVYNVAQIARFRSNCSFSFNDCRAVSNMQLHCIQSSDYRLLYTRRI